MKTSLSASILGIGVALAIGAAAPASNAQSNCSSWAKFTKDIWDKWGAQVKAAGCKDSAECLANKDKKEALVKDIIAFINKESQGSWATLGPRPFVSGQMDGTIDLAGERLFVGMVTENTVNITVKKTKGKASAVVTVSTVDASNNCVTYPGGSLNFSEDESAQQQTIRLSGQAGEQIVVKVDAKGSVTKSFGYSITAN